MNTVIGICGKDFALVAADCYVSYSIIRVHSNEDKIFEIDEDKLLGTAGEDADRINFGEYIQKNLHLQSLRNRGLHTTPRAAANFTRTELALALRQGAYQVDSVLAGFNKHTKQTEMYWIDFLGSLTPIKKGSHGYGAYFVNGLLDQHYHDQITIQEAHDLLKKCFQELHQRFLLSQSIFIVKSVDENGIRAQKVQVSAPAA